jgi:hypothetical protein
MSNDQIFLDWYEKTLRDIRKAKRGTRSTEVAQRAEWQRLSKPQKFMLQIFFNAVEGHPDDAGFFDGQFVKEFQRNDAASLLDNPDVKKLIDLFLGEETPEEKL